MAAASAQNGAKRPDLPQAHAELDKVTENQSLLESKHPERKKEE
jgi:hypothetical protein